MFAIFVISASMIFVGGPLHNEGGIQAIQDKGVQEATQDAWAAREPLDYSKLNG